MKSLSFTERSLIYITLLSEMFERPGHNGITLDKESLDMRFVHFSGDLKIEVIAYCPEKKDARKLRYIFEKGMSHYQLSPKIIRTKKSFYKISILIKKDQLS